MQAKANGLPTRDLSWSNSSLLNFSGINERFNLSKNDSACHDLIHDVSCIIIIFVKKLNKLRNNKDVDPLMTEF